MNGVTGFHIDVRPVSITFARTAAGKSEFRGKNSMFQSAGAMTGATPNAPTAKRR